MKRHGSSGFTVLVVLVTLTILMLMWSAVYQRTRAAIDTEHAGVDRSMYVDGPRLAAARALEFVARSRPTNKLLTYRVRVETTDGPFTYLVTIATVGGRQKGNAPSRYRIRVRPAGQNIGGVTQIPGDRRWENPDDDGWDDGKGKGKGKGPKD